MSMENSSEQECESPPGSDPSSELEGGKASTADAATAVPNSPDGTRTGTDAVERFVPVGADQKEQNDDSSVSDPGPPYPKCGSALLQFLVFGVLNRGQPSKDFADFVARAPYLEWMGIKSVLEMRRPGAIKTHLPFEKNPHSQHAKYIYMARNPFDCCASYYMHMKTMPLSRPEAASFDVFFDAFLEGKVIYGDYFDHVLSWYDHRNDPNVLFITYEDVKSDPGASTLRIADFIDQGIGRELREDPVLLSNVLKIASANNMTTTCNQGMRSILADELALTIGKEQITPAEFYKNVFAEALEIAEGSDFTRKPICGRWKEFFKPEQVQRMKEWIDKKTAGSDVYATVASGSSGSSSSTFSSAETASIEVLEERLQNQQRRLQNQHSQLQNQQNLIDKLLQSQKRQQELIDKLLESYKVQQEISYNTHQQRQDLENTSSQPGTTLPKADVQAIVDGKCTIFQEAFVSNIHAMMEKIVQSAIEKKNGRNLRTTLNAKIDGIAAQDNNFIAHVKKTYVTIAQFDSFSNPRQVTRKKARANSHNASRSVSPTRDRRRDIESVEDGNPYLQESIKPNQPDIIALQETNTQNVRLQGYMTCAQTQRTAILVKKALSVQKHEIEQTQTEHTLIEILPERKTQQSLFIANVYSPPRDHLSDFDHFVREIRKRTNAAQKQHLQKIIHNYAGSEEHLLQEIQKKLSGDAPAVASAHIKEYTGTPNPELDQPFTQAELYAALSKLTRNTSPGKDRIVNKQLRNLPHQATTAQSRIFLRRVRRRGGANNRPNLAAALSAILCRGSRWRAPATLCLWRTLS
ncbi:hypothetical protein HPB52_012467 [Rhipicephalus sanguineus]|uniref:Sulfotransferase domain-containing protein n=1 Tax=Rhipicephalus sanguineus TaxID=34632 RepID=A0A9D4QB71_RHISA|nr:hypothetical protein HPB52_012467 [Rhipicephalus sanguineus]